MNIFSRIWDRVKAARRGETRIAPTATRGRIYEKEDGSGSGDSKIAVRAQPIVTITPSRVWSEAEQRWYTVDEWLKRQSCD